MPRTDSTLGPLLIIEDTNASGMITRGSYPGTPPTTANKFAVGAVIADTANTKLYYNAGTVASPSWNSVTETTHTERSSVAAVTANDDGLTTAIIPTGSTFVTVTSAGATKAVSLPAIDSTSVGQQIDVYVGANGYELLTEASSNDTINTVDADGTNQLDVAANTLLRCVQVSATGWMCYQVAATTITVVAPDND